MRGLAHRNVGGLVGAVESGRIGVGIGLGIRRGTGFETSSAAVRTEAIDIKGLMGRETLTGETIFFKISTTGYHSVPFFWGAFASLSVVSCECGCPSWLFGATLF